MENEIWKDIEGYEGCYQISNLGRVKSLKRMVRGFKGDRVVHEKILRQSPNGVGYPASWISKNDTPFNMVIHRLVAKAFILNPDNLPCINHINGIKSDYRIENLEWCTYSYNSIHARQTGLNKGCGFGKDNVRTKAIEVTEIATNKKFVCYGMNEANATTKVDRRLINRCLRKNYISKGFSFSYKVA